MAVWIKKHRKKGGKRNVFSSHWTEIGNTIEYVKETLKQRR
jgi:hypothetical protein